MYRQMSGAAIVAMVLLVAACTSNDSGGEDSTTQTPPDSSSIVESTTVTSPESPDPIWELPQFDGSILLSGSVGSEIRTSDASWEADDDGWWYLLLDGTPTYDLGDSTCVDSGCDLELNELVDGGHFVWVAESSSSFSDELHHAVAPSGETLAACWSELYDGPLVAIDDFNRSVIDRAWVLTEHDGRTTWVGLDPSTIDRDDLLRLPFAGYDFPTC